MQKNLKIYLMMLIKKTVELANEATKILDGSGTMTKKDREQLASLISKIRQEVTSNIPFYKEQFDEQMEKTVVESKSEIEAFIISSIHNAGLKALKNENVMVKLNENNL